MKNTHVVGVDPGVVHSGIVSLHFDMKKHTLTVDTLVQVGADVPAVADWINQKPGSDNRHVFIEKYRTRSNFSVDQQMVEVQAKFRKLQHATLVDNTGVKKIVRQELMQLLELWKFSTPTHHQDLRSAARIALLGMLRQEHLNLTLTTAVIDILDGRPWTIRHS